MIISEKDFWTANKFWCYTENRMLLSVIATLFGILIPLFTFTNTTEAASYDLNPEPVTENSPTATITFSGLQSGRTYYYCLKNRAFEDCLDNNGRGLVAEAAVAERITITVCGDGTNNLKETCGSDDYFHPDNTYHARLYNERDDPTADPAADASFNPTRFLPDISMSPTTNLTPGTTLTINVTGDRWPFSGSNHDKRNNYQITIYGENGTPRPSDNEKCFTVPRNGTGRESFTASTGEYRIEVKEQVNESDCDGGFLYKTFTFNVSEAGGEVTGEIGGSIVGAGRNPCTSAGCDTAVGNIPTDLKEFASSVLRLATGLAGGIALIIMVVGSIQVLTSQGDQQRLNGGREKIVAAIAGLLFLLLTNYILAFIGFNILIGLPGIT